MSINPTPFTALLDDDGTGLVGTLLNKAKITELGLTTMDARWSEFTTTATGPQDNVAYSEADVLRCNNAAALTLRGLLAPVPAKPGKRLVITAVGAGTVTLNDQDANSTAANRIVTGTAAPVTLAAGVGFAWLVYDGTAARWRLVGSSSGTGGAGATTGTFTPTDASGAGLSFTAPSGAYAKIGPMVFFGCQVTYPNTTDGNAAQIGNLPYVCVGEYSWGGVVTYMTAGLGNLAALMNPGTATLLLSVENAVQPQNSALSGKNVRVAGLYLTA